MNYYSYNVLCLITSILMLIIVSFKFKNINLCVILLLASIFSIMWRSIKLIKGKYVIEKDNNHNHSINNPFFIADFTFASLAYLCVLSSKQINKKLILLTFFIFFMAFMLNIYNSMYNENGSELQYKLTDASQTIHFYGHCVVVLVVFSTFYLHIH